MRKAAEEEKKAAAEAGDFESSDEEETRGAQIEIGVGKVKDIKEVKKEKQMASKAAEREQDFWKKMEGGITQTSTSTGASSAT